jgi:ABC-type antimicrobial peptide transport system permease subunit
MGRVKEVGVLRAIGVSKRNLLFRFAVETALLMVLTVLLGYLLSSWFIVSLSDAPLFSSVFYFPTWLGIAMLVIVAAAGLFFGVLPAMFLLRKTPSEILAKYDV